MKNLCNKATELYLLGHGFYWFIYYVADSNLTALSRTAFLHQLERTCWLLYLWLTLRQNSTIYSPNRSNYCSLLRYIYPWDPTIELFSEERCIKRLSKWATFLKNRVISIINSFFIRAKYSYLSWCFYIQSLICCTMRLTDLHFCSAVCEKS